VSNVAKISDIAGMLISIYLGFTYIPLIRKYYDVASGITNLDGGSWYTTMYFLLFGACYGFYRSLVRSNNDPDESIRQWSFGRIVAWPLLLLSFGIYKLFASEYGV
jgi:hypothetical protein